MVNLSAPSAWSPKKTQCKMSRTNPQLIQSPVTVCRRTGKCCMRRGMKGHRWKQAGEGDSSGVSLVPARNQLLVLTGHNQHTDINVQKITHFHWGCFLTTLLP